MSDRECKIDGCNGDICARGWCSKHYTRWQQHGDPHHTKHHGMVGTPIYWAWKHMRQRCTNPNNNAYKHYGGRDIEVCARWRDSFTAFYEDMGDKPTPKHQIDRIDNDGDYEPSNCRWVTPAENIQNRSIAKLSKKKVRRIREKYANGDGTQSAIGEQFGVDRSMISHIVRGKSWQNAPGPIKGKDY